MNSHTRDALAIEVDTSLPGPHVVRCGYARASELLNHVVAEV